ncbi:hypothetical protein [Roseovarius sp. D0-M9]|uniref:hypothetical protein n=1 Tax=Roseovarius sp. D0-M9 TaxID=3127117 RepID=UPI00301045C6
MSDPVTNVEIEDVLSSIRRLVSNDGRALKPEAEATKPSPEPDRLVLTPSLRVDEAARNAAADTSGSVDAPAPLDLTESDRVIDPAPEPGQSHGDQILADNREDDDPADEIRTSGQGDADWDEADLNDPAQDEESGADSSEFGDEVDSNVAQNDIAGGDDPSPDADRISPEAGPLKSGDEPIDRTDALKMRVAELEEVVARQSDQWEPDSPDTGDNSGGTVSPLPWEDYTPGDDDAEAQSGPIDDAAQAIEDAIAKAANRPTAASGDDAGDEDDDVPHNFAAPESGSKESDTMAAGAARGDTADFLAGSDEFLDEDALRDLVADIVRQELQGALGERITRNVRKLVRREIHRALASQELD